MSLIYCVDNKLGGVTSLNYNLAANYTDGNVKQIVLHIDSPDWEMSRADIPFPVDENLYFKYNSKDLNNYEKV